MRAWRGHSVGNGLGPHAAAWDALNRSHFKSHPLLDSRFWNGLLRHYGRPGVTLWELRDGDSVLAMCLLQRAGWGHWHSFLPDQAQLGPVMIPETSMVDELLRGLRPFAAQLDLLCLDPDVTSLDPDPARRARMIPHSLTMNVRTMGTFEEYWEARSTALRQNLRRYERLAEKDGLSFTHRVVTAANEVAEGVARYAELESKGWKGAEGTALSPGNEQARFYTELLAAYAATGQAAVQELWAGDRLAASRLLIHAGGMIVMLKATYDESLAKFAVGWRLLAAALQAAFADPTVNRVEFYTNAHHGQLPWASETRTIRHVSYYRRGALGMVGYRAQTIRLVSTAPARIPSPSAPYSVTRHETSAQTTRWDLHDGERLVAALMVRVAPGRSRGVARFEPDLPATLNPELIAILLRHVVKRQSGLGSLWFAPMDARSDGFLRLGRALELAGLVTAKFEDQEKWGVVAYNPASPAGLFGAFTRPKRHEHP